MFYFFLANIIEKKEKKKERKRSNDHNIMTKLQTQYPLTRSNKKFLLSSPKHTSVTNAPTCELSLKAVF